MSFLSFSRARGLGFLSLAAVLGTASIPALAAPSVVATIKPVHSLAAAIMEGVGSPTLLIDGAASPHSFSLKPSQAGELQSADLVFWVGEALETSLAKPLGSLPASGTVIELMETPGLVLLPFRDHDGFGHHDHDDEPGHDDHAHGDAHGDDHDHGHDEAKDEHEHGEDHAHSDDHEHGEKHEEGHAAHDDHDGHDHHGSQDPHIWLDPQNAILMAGEIAKALTAADPSNAAIYARNADALTKAIESQSASIDRDLSDVRDRPFVVFHDAYHYFEDHFDIAAAGAITLNPETPAGADRVREVRDTIKDKGVVCVFSEPQFEPKLISVVIEGTEAKTAVLDPLGSALENGPGLYQELLQQISDAMKSCLSPS